MVADTLVDGWQRARQPEQKEQRREEILAAAARLFDREGFDGITLNGVAREANLAKSNLYRYFESLEEILLHLLLADYDDLLTELESAEHTEGVDVAAVARLFAELILNSPRFAELLTRLSGVLERNLSPEIAEHFKREISARSERLATMLHHLLPSLEGVNMMEVMLAMTALVSGFWPMAHPSPVMREVVSKPDLQHLQVRFIPAFSRALEAYLLGMMTFEASDNNEDEFTGE